MTLTGVPLIVLAWTATAGTAALTVLGWPRLGRLRPLTRTAGLLLTEVLLVASIGLVVNRAQRFYPSWAALTGEVGTTAVSRPPAPGRLDRQLTSPVGKPVTIVWRPPSLARWRLSGPPRIIVPADYRARTGDRFPVVLDLAAAEGPAVAAAQHTADAVTVVVLPTRNTAAAALRDLPAELTRDVRVTTLGWAVLAAAAQAALAAGLIHAEAPGFAAVRAAPTATAWAAGRLPAPLAAPLRLPA